MTATLPLLEGSPHANSQSKDKNKELSKKSVFHTYITQPSCIRTRNYLNAPPH
ncbi:hypothetical protein Hanom_Chr08g00744011 [Helianthus anomalus]